jgi:hypothetical protein
MQGEKRLRPPYEFFMADDDWGFCNMRKSRFGRRRAVPLSTSAEMLDEHQDSFDSATECLLDFAACGVTNFFISAGQ